MSEIFLKEQLEEHFSSADGFVITHALAEITLVVPAEKMMGCFTALRNDFKFSLLIDIAGIDYSTYHNYTGTRFAVNYHFLSIERNLRLRVRVFCPDDDFPCLQTVTTLWPAANWFEREAFDLFGIIFEGHEDLRRLLTDYGFVGHPFRKDFPLSGHVEMRYDPEQKRVIYQPVSIEPREITPRTVREESFGKETI